MLCKLSNEFQIPLSYFIKSNSNYEVLSPTENIYNYSFFICFICHLQMADKYY